MARDYKFEAREALKDFWVISILIALTAILLGGVSLGSLKDSKKNDIEIAHRNAYYNIVEHPMKPGSYYYDFKETGNLLKDNDRSPERPAIEAARMSREYLKTLGM